MLWEGGAGNFDAQSISLSVNLKSERPSREGKRSSSAARGLHENGDRGEKSDLKSFSALKVGKILERSG